MPFLKKKWLTIDSSLVKDWESITFEGDSNARRQDWTQLWRLQWKWRILQISAESKQGLKPYNICFSTSSVTKLYRCAILTPFVAVRIGGEDVTFSACSYWRGTKLHLRDFGFYGSKRDMQSKFTRKALVKNVTFT